MLKAFLIMAVGFFGIVGFAIIMAISLNNTAVNAEQGIKAQYEDNQNVLSQYSLKIGEAIQIPSMYKNGLKEVVSAAMQGRYGQDGSKAVFQFIKESNLNLDPKMYEKVQDMIEKGRNKFETSQTSLIDKKQNYQKLLNYAVSGTVLRILGFPKINLADYKIIKSDYSNKAFDSGVDNGMKFTP